MTLPASRNTSYTPGSPVKSADLNDLQDMIVGGRHGDLVIPVPAAAWQQQAGGGGLLGDGQWTFSGLTKLVAPLPFAAGTSIVQVEYCYNRGGAGTITVQARKRNIAAGTVAARIGLLPAGDTTGASWETHVDQLDYTVESNTAVWLEIQCDNAANVFGGALVTIRK